MILRKVAIPVGVDKRSYWESMILGITNDKFYALRANFKQELFEQYQGEFRNTWSQAFLESIDMSFSTTHNFA